MTESLHLRWFEHFPKCRCGRTSEGILRGDQNQSFGYHCMRCANKRLRDSERARHALAPAASASPPDAAHSRPAQEAGGRMGARP